ncbi:recombinase family protein [Streptomyces althioticus]|uniref:recombinase family protein n=1 Tax=Streptomyces althioticus TaxID=83380 RepID=UPI0036A97191
MYRTPWDLEDLVDLAEATGVTLAAAQAQGVLDLSTPSGRLAARIGAVVARNETEMRVERQVLGHQRRRNPSGVLAPSASSGTAGTGKQRRKPCGRRTGMSWPASPSGPSRRTGTHVGCSRRTGRSGAARTFGWSS